MSLCPNILLHIIPTIRARDFGYTQEVHEFMAFPNQNTETWESVANRMPLLLSDLKSDTLRSRDLLGELPEQGIYVFYLGDKPMYVGRTDRMRQRLLEHGRPSSTHNAATLAPIHRRDECRGGLKG